jgi:acyl-CoA reductase-like NAD-dependent aldehyde dehydrogenase
MERLIHLFRRGHWYESLDVEPIPGLTGTGLCLAPEIVLRDDARHVARMREAEPLVPEPKQRLDILRSAIDAFQYDDLEVGGLGRQSGADFAAAMDAVAGLPTELTARWCELLRSCLETLEPRGAVGTLTLVHLPANTFTCLDAVCQTVAGGGTVWIRPSRREPISAARFVAALLTAGWPASRLGFYPTSTTLFRTLAALTDEQVVYGGAEMADRAGERRTLTMHGPGRGLAVVPAQADPDEVADRLADLIAADSGRFCRNVRTVACLGDPEPIAQACGSILDRIRVTPADQRWPVAAVSEPTAVSMAEVVSTGLGRQDVRVTTREPLLEAHGRHWLAPTLVRLRWSPSHPLLNRELPFPFAAVVHVDTDQLAALRTRSLFVYDIPGRGSASR